MTKYLRVDTHDMDLFRVIGPAISSSGRRSGRVPLKELEDLVMKRFNFNALEVVDLDPSKLTNAGDFSVSYYLVDKGEVVTKPPYCEKK